MKNLLDHLDSMQPAEQAAWVLITAILFLLTAECISYLAQKDEQL
jgi:hypothetical protein